MSASVNSEVLWELIVAKRGSALVLFSAGWCGDCTAFAPIWERWASGKSGLILSVEVSRAGAEWDDWELDEIPTVIAFSEGVEKARAEGAITHGDLERLLDKISRLRPSEKNTMQEGPFTE